MKRNQFFLSLTLALTLLFTVFYATACGGSKTEIVDFADKTVTAEYGEMFVFTETSVKDTDGNTYRVDISVKTKGGDAVEVVANQFEVTDKGGYTATCSVTLSDDSKVTRTITINVIEIAGVMVSEFANNLFAGDVVTVPQCKLTEKINNTVLVENMTYAVSYYGEAVTVTADGKFTPTLSGVYVVKYSAEYQGKTYTKTASVTINRQAAAATEVESFDSQLSLDNFIPHNGSNKKEWLSSFEGENGVLKWTHSGGTWPAFSFVPRQSMTAYADYGYIVFRMYVEDVASAVQYFRLINNADVQREVEIGDSVKKGQWFDYAYEIDGFLEHWADEGTDYLLARLWSESGSAGGSVYIADISVLKKNTQYTDIDATVTGEKKEGNELTVTLNNAPAGETTVLTVYDPAGNEVELNNGKLTAVPGEYKIVITLDGYYWSYSDTFTVAPSVDGELLANFEEGLIAGDDVTVPDMRLYNTISNETLVDAMGYSVSYYGASVTVGDKKFTAANSGVYVITYSTEYGGKTYDKVVQITVGRAAPAANEVESFDSPLSTEGFKPQNGTNKAEWLASYEGEQGVLKWTYSADEWPAFGFVQRQNMTVYADYDYIVFRIFVPDTDKAMQYFKLINDGKNTPAYEALEIGASVKKGQWYNYTYAIDGFLDYWKDSGTDYILARLWSRCKKDGEGILYIADISVVKGVSERLNVTHSVVGTKTEGQELTVSLTGEDAASAEFKLLDPSGNIVSLTSGKFTAVAGTYTVKITAEGYYGAITETFQVKKSIDTQLMGEFATDIMEGDEVAVPDVRLYNTVSDATLIAEVGYTVTFGGGTVTVTAKKFTALYAGVYTVAYSAEYESETYTYTKELTVYAENYAVYDNQHAVNTVSADNSAVISFVDAAAIAVPDSGLPALDGGDTGYIAIKAGGTSKWFNLTLPPQCNFNDYSAADCLEIKLYISGSTAQDGHGMHFKNNKIATVKGGSWQTIKMPLTIWQETQHGGFAYSSMAQMFESVKTSALLMFNEWAQNTTVYIASIKPVKDTVDNTLGDKFAHLSAVSCNGAAVAATFDEKEVIKVTGGTWANIFIKPGKTVAELAEYDKVVVTLYIEGDSDIEFYSQAKLRGATGNDLVSYGTITKGSWQTVEIDMDRVLEIHAGLYVGNNALMIVRGKAFTAIYISDIVCVKA